MAILTQRDFSGGLVNAADPQVLQRNMLQESSNADTTRPGVVKPKRGWLKINSDVLPNDISDLFFQNIFTTKGLILRTNDTLYEMNSNGRANLIQYGVSEVTHNFCEFGDWVIIVNGVANRKFKQAGVSIMFHIGLSFPWEASYAGTTYASALCFRQVVVSNVITHWACYDWEKEMLDGTGGGGTDLYAAAYTSSCHLDGYDYSATDPPGVGADSTLRLLLNMDGVDGHKAFTDEGATVHTVTAVGTAEGDTSLKKFGTASVVLDGDADYLQVPDHADWNFGTGRLTIGAYVRHSGDPGDGGIIGSYEGALVHFSLRYHEANGWLSFIVYDTVDSAILSMVATGCALSPDKWHLVEVVRGWGDDDDEWAITLNGVEKKTSTGAITMPNLAAPLRIGSLFAGTNYWKGNIDGVYIYKGKALHTAAFTPPDIPMDPSIDGLEYRPWPYCVQLGITTPDSSLMTAAEINDGAGAIVDGDYKYKVTYVNEVGFESNAGADRASVTIAAGPSDVSLTVIPCSTDPQVIARKLYRTEVGGTLYRFVVELTDNHTTIYTDDMLDTALGDYMHQDIHDVPVAAIDCCSHLANLFLLQSPSTVWWSKGFNEWEYFPGTNYEPFGSPPTAATGQKIWSFGEYLAVMLDTEIWHLEGSSDIDFIKKKSLANRGPVHTRAVAHRGDVIYFLDGAGVFMYDQVRDIEVTKAVRSLFTPEWLDNDRIDLDNRSVSRMAYLDGELIVLYPSNGVAANDRMLRHNVLTESFDLHSGIAFTDVTADSKGKKFYVCAGKYVYELYGDEYRGDGATDSYCHIHTKEYAMEEELGGAYVMKEVEWIAFDLDADANCVVYFYVDGTVVDSWTITAGLRQVYRKRLDVAQKGYRLSLRVWLVGATSEFFGFSLGVRPSVTL